MVRDRLDGSERTSGSQGALASVPCFEDNPFERVRMTPNPRTSLLHLLLKTCHETLGHRCECETKTNTGCVPLARLFSYRTRLSKRTRSSLRFLRFSNFSFGTFVFVSRERTTRERNPNLRTCVRHRNGTVDSQNVSKTRILSLIEDIFLRRWTFRPRWKSRCVAS